MYLSAERLALVNKEIRENFARTSIAWQAIPHWDICDPGKTRVPNGDISSPLFVDVLPQQEPLQITVAQATAPTPDSLIAAATATTVALAAKVDRDVLPKLLKAKASVAITSTGPQDLQDALIEARALLEDAGYRAPSCLLTNLNGLKLLNTIVGDTTILRQLLAAANVNSLHRTDALDPAAPAKAIRILLIGRRQLIPHCSATDASPGEEPADLAVSVFPSLEVVGETATGTIELSVRVRYATRVKDPDGLAGRTKG